MATALVAALVTGAYTSLRLSQPNVVAVLTASAASAMPALVVAALVRLVGSSWGGAEGREARPLWLALALTGTCAFVLALAAGRVLRATTHHTGLAGVTFAVAVVIAALVLLPLALRVAGLTVGWSHAKQSALLAAALLALSAVAGLALVRVHHGIREGDLTMHAGLSADLALLLLVSVLLSCVSSPRAWFSKAIAVVAPPMFVALLVVGFSLSRAHPELSAELSERALLAARCSAWIVP